MRVMIVDDEALARERLRALLAETEVPVDVVGEAASGKQALPLIHAERPDLVFLDVQMPVLDGFDVLDLIAPPRPHVVFVTAYDEYALRAFEVHALDYLTKPVNLERLRGSLQRIQGLVAQQAPDPALDAFTATRTDVPLRRLTLHVGSRLRVVDPAEVQYFEARDKLVLAHTGRSAPHVDFPLQQLEQRLDAAQFLRIHRAFLVNVTQIRELVPWFSGTYQLKLMDGRTLPLARRRVRAVKAFLKGER